MSLVEGGFKTFLFSRERKLDFMGTGDAVLEHPKKGNVEGGAQVVDSIPDNEAQFWRDGYAGFREYGPLSKLRLIADHKLRRTLSKIAIRLSAEASDVMLGPFNL